MPAASGTGTTRGGQKNPNPRDFTGVQKAKLEAQHADEIEERAEELAVAAQVTARRKATEVIDYSKGGHAAPEQIQPGPQRGISEELAAEIDEADEVEVGPKSVKIRVKFKIEDMVFGRDQEAGILNFYSFDEGRTYLVPVPLAEHLDELGYLYH